MRLLILLLMLLVVPSSWAEETDAAQMPESAEITDAAQAENVAAKEAEQDKPLFDILEYRITGNSVLPNGKIEETVYPFMGEGKTVDDAERARAALEKAFHDAGYLTVFVNIPEQDVGKGVVRLEVQEGQVEKLRVVGSKYYSLGAIKDRVPEFAEGKVPYFPEVQKQLSALNAADRKVAPVLRPGKSPGKVEVDLKVQDNLPFHGSLEINDRYSANTTKTRLSGSVRYDNLWQRDHSISLSFQVTPQNTDETKVFSGTYVIPHNGDYWALYGVISKSNIAAVGDLSVIGNGNILGLRYIHPLPVLEGFSHSLTLGVDYKDFKESTLQAGNDTGSTPISYLPFTVGYDATLQGEKSTTQLNLGINFSLRGIADDQIECLPGVFANEFACKRSGGKASYAYIKGELKHTQQLYKGWQLYGSLGGQVTAQPLISNEEFSIGGQDTVRGYLESFALGDQGVNGTLELRTPSLAKYLTEKISDLHALAFVDAGYAKVLQPQAGQAVSFSLASAGLGVRLKGPYGLFGELDYANVLRASGKVAEGDYRVHFRVGYDW